MLVEQAKRCCYISGNVKKERRELKKKGRQSKRHRERVRRRRENIWPATYEVISIKTNKVWFLSFVK